MTVAPAGLSLLTCIRPHGPYDKDGRHDGRVRGDTSALLTSTPFIYNNYATSTDPRPPLTPVLNGLHTYRVHGCNTSC